MRYVPEAYGYCKRKGIEYARPDGKPLRMTLYMPEDGGQASRPGMVLIHGGAWILGTRYQQAWYCRQFARAGFVVMTVDYRLMPRFAFPKCLHDCKAAVRWLRLHADELGVNPNRIVSFGASAGGHLAALLAATRPEDGLEGDENPGPSSSICAAVSLYGAVDLTCYRDLPSRGPLRRATTRFMVDFSGREAISPPGTTWEKASPITYASDKTAPILFVHGKKDFLVHFEQSRRFHARLRELGVPAEFIALDNRGHGFDYVHWGERRSIFRKMLAFLAARIESHAPESPTCESIQEPRALDNERAAGDGMAG
ncbi:MAG: alpha/beta hydrolase [Candidatus Hydrogenedentes bacterium]|nr:alpha/beta hydrolase [Candidatus Hydrogenedentota bacterium]